MAKKSTDGAAPVATATPTAAPTAEDKPSYLPKGSAGKPGYKPCPACGGLVKGPQTKVCPNDKCKHVFTFVTKGESNGTGKVRKTVKGENPLTVLMAARGFLEASGGDVETAKKLLSAASDLLISFDDDYGEAGKYLDALGGK